MREDHKSVLPDHMEIDSTVAKEISRLMSTHVAVFQG